MSRIPPPFRQRRKNLRVRSALLLGRVAPRFFARHLQRPVFVVGCARSGTTLLAAMLGTHPQVAEWSEVNYLWDPGWYPWRPAFSHKLPLEVDAAGFTERWWRENRHRGPQIAAAFGAYQALEGRPVFVNKSPFHTFRIPRLLEMFPDSRFVHVVRDGRAVAHSYAAHLLRKDKLREWPEELRGRFAADANQLVLHTAGVWSQCLQEVEERDRELSLVDRRLLLEISYEELVSRPEATLERLHRFLGVEPRPNDARAWELRDQNHKWRTVLTAGTKRNLEARLAADLERRGYRP